MRNIKKRQSCLLLNRTPARVSINHIKVYKEERENKKINKITRAAGGAACTPKSTRVAEGVVRWLWVPVDRSQILNHSNQEPIKDSSSTLLKNERGEKKNKYLLGESSMTQLSKKEHKILNEMSTSTKHTTRGGPSTNWKLVTKWKNHTETKS